jgi:hypothetical protein
VSETVETRPHPICTHERERLLRRKSIWPVETDETDVKAREGNRRTKQAQSARLAVSLLVHALWPPAPGWVRIVSPAY